MQKGIELSEFLKIMLNTPGSIFDNMTAIQYAQEQGWETVFTSFSLREETVYCEENVAGLKKMIMKLLEESTENARTLKIDEGIFLKLQAQLKVTTEALREMLNADISHQDAYNELANDVHKRFVTKMDAIGESK